ncbi:AAA family ATPase [Paenibacillus caui]|uniref:AAA family ATPase n=1 Tax=Paenibacillus caui TaxID=2873927 RepID=UPI001F43EFAC|nr:AAA family ATPase [Paenibacillus caui]
MFQISKRGAVHIRIRIIGACGSGKSYIAKELSKTFGINCYETDNLVWDRSYENKRFPVEVRDAKLNQIVNTESWIIEGVHHKWGRESFKEADFIFIIVPNKFIRDLRVVLRFIKTRLGIERWNYKQTFKNLWQMLFIWNKAFDKQNLKEILELTMEYSDKRIIVQDNKEVLKYMLQYRNGYNHQI